MANSTEYIASDGERWDTIAYKAYGDVNKVNDLIEANPTIPIAATLDGGTRILIPIVESVEIEVDTALLPPWKR